MRGMNELLFFLFSFSDNMLTVLVKPYIVNIIETQEKATASARFSNVQKGTNSSSPVVKGFNVLVHDILSIKPDLNGSFTQLKTLNGSTIEHTIGHSSFVQPTLRSEHFENRTRTVSRLTIADKKPERGLKISTVNDRNLKRAVPACNATKEPCTSGDGENTREKSSVQTKAAMCLMIDLVGTYLPWLILGPLCGMWSDRHGRKLPLLLPSISHVLSVVTYILVYYRPDHLVAVIIVGSLCRGVTGKHAMFSMLIYSVTSDTYEGAVRSARFTLLTAARYIGLSLGSLSAGFLVDTVGVQYSIVTSSAIPALTVVLIIAFVDETLDESSASKKSSIVGTVTGTLRTIVMKILYFLCRHKEPKDKKPSYQEITVAVSYHKEITANGSFREQITGNGSLHESQHQEIIDYESLHPKITGHGTVHQEITDNGPLSSDNTTEEENRPIIPRTAAESEVDRKVQIWRRLLLLLIMVISLLSQALWASERELIVQSVMVPPLNWPDSWYGYLNGINFGITGLTLMILVPLLARVLPASRDPDAVVFIAALVCSIVCEVWTGFAVENVSSWQIFCAFVIGALSHASNAPLKTMMSRCVSGSSQGTAMATQLVLENIAKVLGPITHTAIYVISLPISPSLVYYVMAGEAVLLLPAVVWACILFHKISGR